MERKDYEKILDGMPETGIYVIREEDHRILYANQRAQEVSPEAKVGVACGRMRDGACRGCPLMTIEDREKSRLLSYNEAYGGVVEITAARITWEDDTPAFLVSVVRRIEASGHTYRKILHVDLLHDSCEVLRAEQGGWMPEKGSLSVQLETFARSGAVHPDDVERFVAFIRPEHMRTVTENESLSLLYRRKSGKIYRWNLMELVPDLISADGRRFATLCMKDVHDLLQETLAREEANTRTQELIRSLGERNSDIFIIDLKTGLVEPVRMDGEMQENISSLVQPWDSLADTRIRSRLHEAYLDEFDRLFSLEGLRELRKNGQQKTELLCQWSSGDESRYISVTATLDAGMKGRHTVLALQDVDVRMRQELAHTRRDMQMAAVLKSRFKAMTTVNLETGRCERVDLTQPAGPDNLRVGDYELFIRNAVSHHVHPDDGDAYWSALSLEHLRQKAAAVEDYADDVLQYRMRGEPVAWIELHVIYSRQKDHVMVNVLGQDITREKCQEASRQQLLEDRSYIISSLSSLFFTTYYMDLEKETFRTVNQLRRVGDVLGDEINCTAALQLYANHFVHPDDRAEYLKVMNVQNLRQTLRWWQPYVAVEYRKMPEGAKGGPCRWVRATAVLARIGADDMPWTVVYVAQYIGDSDCRASVG